MSPMHEAVASHAGIEIGRYPRTAGRRHVPQNLLHAPPDAFAPLINLEFS